MSDESEGKNEEVKAESCTDEDRNRASKQARDGRRKRAARGQQKAEGTSPSAI